MSRGLRSCDHRYKGNTTNITQQILMSSGRAFQSSVERWWAHPGEGHEHRSTHREQCLARTHAARMQEPGAGLWWQSTATRPCSCTAPELRCHSSVSCTTNPVLQRLNHISSQIALDELQKTKEGDENSQINTKVQTWNYSSKITFPVWPLVWNSLHFQGTTAGTNKLIDIWQSYTTTMHSCSVAFFFWY